MNFTSLKGLFARPTRRRTRKAPTPCIGRFCRMSLEPLEDRRLLTVSTAYFHDHWEMVVDNAPTGVASVGDIVNNGYDGDGSIAGVYGVDAFGRVYQGGVSSFAGTGYVVDAIEATNSTGTTIVLASAAGEGLALSDPDKTISLGSTPHTFTLYGGLSVFGLHLTDGTLSLGINDVAQDKIIVATGTINLTGSELNVFFGGTATTGTYTIIENAANFPITGTFAGLPEGATFVAGDRTFQISYTGGLYGNDVTLTMTALINPFSSFVNDNWYDVNEDELVAGDMVDDRNDTGGVTSPTTITRSFEQVALDPNGFQSAAYDNFQQAAHETSAGGAVTVLPGEYSGDVTIEKPLAIQGEFTLNGSLIADGTTLIVGTGYGTIGVDDLTLTSTSKLLMTASSTDSDLIEVGGDLDLGGAELKFQWAGGAAEDVILINNQGSITGTFADLPEGAEILVNGAKFWITYAGGDGNDVALVIPDSTVAARRLFYEHSRYDGNTTGVSTSDDGAIAPDKMALLPGVLAAFNNVSSYSRGINGIMVDITGSHSNITADDLFFEVGIPENEPGVPNNPAPTSWITAPAPATVSVRADAGTGGADRVEIIWADEDIQNEWLRVTVLSTIDTGLASPDVFYFGNRVGDSGDGNQPSRAVTNAIDENGVLSHNTVLPAWEPITNIYDFDRSGRVNAFDQNEARQNGGSLYYMTPQVIPPVGQLVGPTSWTPGTDVTLVASAPTLLDGTVDPNVLGVDFYQDVNGNGIFDQDDELMANGTALEDNLGNPSAWQGTFDPADLLAGRSSILAVPLNSAGPIGASRSIAGRLPIIVASPLFHGVEALQIPGLGFNIILPATAVAANAQARATFDFGGPYQVIAGDYDFAESAGTTLAMAAEVAGFATSPAPGVHGEGTSAGLGFTNVVGGRIGEIIGQTSTSAGASADENHLADAGASATFGGAVTFQIVSSNAPDGTPVNIVQSVLAIGLMFEGSAGGMSIAAAAGGTGNLNLLGNPLNGAFSQIIQARVGQFITVVYGANANFNNLSLASSEGIGGTAGLQFFQFDVSGIYGG